MQDMVCSILAFYCIALYKCDEGTGIGKKTVSKKRNRHRRFASPGWFIDGLAVAFFWATSVVYGTFESTFAPGDKCLTFAAEVKVHPTKRETRWQGEMVVGWFAEEN